jgi:hypothetical protein
LLQSTALDAHNEAKTVILTIDVVVSNIWMAESPIYRSLFCVSNEPAEFSKAVDSAFTKIDPTSTRFGNNVDMEVFETIVSVEVKPFKLKFERIAREMDVRNSCHFDEVSLTVQPLTT